ncbi:ankyrin repeat-containing protein ITN1-like [Papaver somniferum]|uniref:ankyrin repeat-containing protein ITN1-like n=1 Tax=Papaver somniferum TaxID=3469 RepID=UPI000E7024EC|nr:ankyrin repeat-containing protein ITN1-like [Papaver somniferum]
MSKNKNMASSLSPHELGNPQFPKNAQSRVEASSSNIEMKELLQENCEYHHETTHNESGSWDLNKYMSLYKAAQKGDWLSAKKLFQDDPNAVTAKITNFSEMAIHVAATAGHSEFVEELLKIMPLEALEFKETKDGKTLLHLAAISGITEAGKGIVKVNPRLAHRCNNSGWVPLLSAATHVSSSSSERQKKMVDYLYSVTRDENPSPFNGYLGATLVCTLIKAGFYDIALSLVDQYPDLAIATDKKGVSALEVLSQQPTAFLSGTHVPYFSRLMYKYIQVESPSTCQKRQYVIKGDAEDPPEIPGNHSISKGVIAKFLKASIMTRVSISVLPEEILRGYYNLLKTKQALALVKGILARISQMPNSDISDYFAKFDIIRKFSKSGISEFIMECLQTFPFQTNKQEILKIAVEQRNGDIFRLVYDMNVDQKLLSFQDESGSTILHLAAKIAPLSHLKRFGGEVFQMQEELRWFKVVANIVPEIHKSRRNDKNKTAHEVFREEHKDLMQKAENWAKGTAESSMLVASLVATVVFAAAITVPGGNINDGDDKNNGTPIFILEKAFMVFVVADALAFFSSITSAMMFITVLTSSYTEIDFLMSLPHKIIVNLMALSFSIGAMMVTFSAVLYIILVNRFPTAAIPISLMASMPIILFALLVLPLLLEMVHQTYGTRDATAN